MYRTSEEFARPAQVEVDEVGRILLQAAQVIEQRGWCQRSYGFDGGPVCIIGALYALKTPFHLYRDADARIGSHVGHPVSWWNDHVCRSKDEAVSALRAAAIGGGR